ncbi:MAG TPA: hypothetical protein VFO41_13735 [Alphaproteobacteria bacterium]|nr:hypothetical protein [Alphaproteobacteria bacterium]
MHVYRVTPVVHWAGWASLDEALASGRWPADEADRVRQWAENAQRNARTLGWDGTTREGPYLAGLPNAPGELRPCFLVAWKQDSGGTTFVASPFPLPWLETGAEEWGSFPP